MRSRHRAGGRRAPVRRRRASRTTRTPSSSPRSRLSSATARAWGSSPVRAASIATSVADRRRALPPRRATRRRARRPERLVRAHRSGRAAPAVAAGRGRRRCPSAARRRRAAGRRVPSSTTEACRSGSAATPRRPQRGPGRRDVLGRSVRWAEEETLRQRGRDDRSAAPAATPSTASWRARPSRQQLLLGEPGERVQALVRPSRADPVGQAGVPVTRMRDPLSTARRRRRRSPPRPQRLRGEYTGTRRTRGRRERPRETEPRSGTAEAAAPPRRGTSAARRRAARPAGPGRRRSSPCLDRSGGAAVAEGQDGANIDWRHAGVAIRAGSPSPWRSPGSRSRAALNATLYSPAGFVRDYLDALELGRRDGARDLRAPPTSSRRTTSSSTRDRLRDDPRRVGGRRIGGSVTVTIEFRPGMHGTALRAAARRLAVQAVLSGRSGASRPSRSRCCTRRTSPRTASSCASATRRSATSPSPRACSCSSTSAARRRAADGARGQPARCADLVAEANSSSSRRCRSRWMPTSPVRDPADLMPAGPLRPADRGPDRLPTTVVDRDDADRLDQAEHPRRVGRPRRARRREPPGRVKSIFDGTWRPSATCRSWSGSCGRRGELGGVPRVGASLRALELKARRFLALAATLVAPPSWRPGPGGLDPARWRASAQRG